MKQGYTLYPSVTLNSHANTAQLPTIACMFQRYDHQLPAPSDEQVSGSRLIATILSPALRLWLLTQVEQVEALQFRIHSSDRQLLSGRIQQVVLQAKQAAYQGLNLSHVHLVASDIQINIGQILKGKPLKLLNPIPVTGELQLQEADLNASLRSTLLTGALRTLLNSLVVIQPQPSADPVPVDQLILRDAQIQLGVESMGFSCTLIATDGAQFPIGLQLTLQRFSDRELQFGKPTWLLHIPMPTAVSLRELEHLTLDLGSNVMLHQVRLQPGEIFCRASLNVLP